MARPHALARIKGSLVNTPHLIEEQSFNAILDYLNDRNNGLAELSNVDVTPEMASEVGGHYVPESRTGVLNVQGPLTYRTTGWEALCGGTSYEMLKENMESFVGQGAKTVVMMVDSGGGEAHGMMDSANYIRKLADENGIKLIAYVDGMSASAGYGLTSIADEIVMSSDSMVGSIGVLIQLMNNSKQLEMNGIERTFITAGKDKVPYAEDGSFTESFIDGLQEQVDALYEGFTSHVATHRDLSVQAVKDTEANVFMADKALELGLADKIMSAEEFYDYLADSAQSNIQDEESGVKNPFKKSAQTQTDMTEAEMSQVTELTTQLAGVQTQLSEQGAQLAEALAAVTVLTGQLEASKAALKEVEEAKAVAALEARRAALAEVMPAEQVEGKLAAYGALDEATFSFMVSELQAAKEARAASFKAIGEDGVEQEDEQAPAAAAYANLLDMGKAKAKSLR